MLDSGRQVRRIHPTITRTSDDARWKPLSRNRSDEKAVISIASVPHAYGATVNRFVFTVLYPNLPMICVRKVEATDAATP